MEIESPAQSLKKNLEEKSKTKGVAHGKRAKDLTMTSPRKTALAEGSASMHQAKSKFWLGFEAMEKLAKEQGL